MDLDLNCRDISSRGEDYPYSYSNQSETEQGLANERPVFRSRGLSRPIGRPDLAGGICDSPVIY